ncbi:hypothetical protein EG329_001201 [Mollisiaceae sp. DMI_Dod_QoI]|nr:hypothetical protein EG329_001201 [Helotiales sp. DMI_Dod_QoI]
MTKYVAESERLGLQLLSLEEHLDGYHDIMSDVRTVKFLHREPSKSLEESRAHMISRALSSPENPHKEMYAILLRGSEDSNRKPKMIGSVGIPRVPVDGSAVEVGYGVNPNYWGMGIAPEALQLFTRFYWNIREGERKDMIIAYTAPANISSQRVLEKSGFTKGELIKQAYEAPDMLTQEMTWYPASRWHLERPK